MLYWLARMNKLLKILYNTQRHMLWFPLWFQKPRTIRFVFGGDASVDSHRIVNR
jgi:hypothetical protein